MFLFFSVFCFYFLKNPPFLILLKHQKQTPKDKSKQNTNNLLHIDNILNEIYHQLVWFYLELFYFFGVPFIFIQWKIYIFSPNFIDYLTFFFLIIIIGYWPQLWTDCFLFYIILPFSNVGRFDFSLLYPIQNSSFLFNNTSMFFFGWYKSIYKLDWYKIDKFFFTDVKIRVYKTCNLVGFV